MVSCFLPCIEYETMKKYRRITHSHSFCAGGCLAASNAGAAAPAHWLRVGARTPTGTPTGSARWCCPPMRAISTTPALSVPVTDAAACGYPAGSSPPAWRLCLINPYNASSSCKDFSSSSMLIRSFIITTRRDSPALRLHFPLRHACRPGSTPFSATPSGIRQ